MELNLDPSWKQHLAQEFKKPYFQALSSFVNQEYVDHTCYPAIEYIFNAFNATPFDRVKVVLLGQDPYHGAGQAHGLAFSVQPGTKYPPSLRNIFQELYTDVGKNIPSSGHLDHWAQQGVLLLNATLTVREGQAGSHQKKGWEHFTDAVIKMLNDEKEGLVFLLWGGQAHKKAKFIDAHKHHILKAGHPSPLSANRGYWFDNRCFSKTNGILEQAGQLPIEW